MAAGAQGDGAPVTDVANAATFPPKYLLAADSIQRTGRELVAALSAARRQEFAPEPVVIVAEAGVALRSLHRGSGREERHVIHISTNLVALWQHLSHAVALDDVEPGFAARYIRVMAASNELSNRLVLPPLSHPDAWTLKVLNLQAGYFRAMAGGMIAIEIVHHRDGMCRKYPRGLMVGDTRPPALASVVTTSQWRHAVREGARLGAKLAIDPDGLGHLFRLVSVLPSRPAWAGEMISADANLRGVGSNLNDIEMFYQLRE